MVPRVKKIDEILWKMYTEFVEQYMYVQYRTAGPSVLTGRGREWQSHHYILSEIEAKPVPLNGYLLLFAPQISLNFPTALNSITITYEAVTN